MRRRRDWRALGCSPQLHHLLARHAAEAVAIDEDVGAEGGRPAVGRLEDAAQRLAHRDRDGRSAARDRRRALTHRFVAEEPRGTRTAGVHALPGAAELRAVAEEAVIRTCE